LLILPKTGGTAMTLVSGLDSPRSLGFAGGKVFWATSSGVMVMPAGGGAFVTIADDNASNLVSDGTNLYWLSGWNIKWMRLTESASTTLLASDGTISSLAVGGSSLYWVQDGVLVRGPLAGGPTAVISSNNVALVATDSEFVYWTESGSIMKLAQ
jgi:hypothetical protein